MKRIRFVALTHKKILVERAETLTRALISAAKPDHEFAIAIAQAAIGLDDCRQARETGYILSGIAKNV